MGGVGGTTVVPYQCLTSAHVDFGASNRVVCGVCAIVPSCHRAIVPLSCVCRHGLEEALTEGFGPLYSADAPDGEPCDVTIKVDTNAELPFPRGASPKHGRPLCRGVPALYVCSSEAWLGPASVAAPLTLCVERNVAFLFLHHPLTHTTTAEEVIVKVSQLKRYIIGAPMTRCVCACACGDYEPTSEAAKLTHALARAVAVSINLGTPPLSHFAVRCAPCAMALAVRSRHSRAARTFPQLR